MKKLLYILIVLGIVTVIIFRLQGNKKLAENKIYQYDKEQPIQVQADTVKEQSSTTDYTYTGMFEPNRESKLSADVPGKIIRYFAEAGDVVKQGQPLIKLDDALLKLQLSSVALQITGLEADVKRYSILTAADAIQGVQLEKAELGLASAKVQYSTLVEQINKTIISAPFSGVVTLKMSEAGAYAAPGIPLIQLTDISQLRFTINVPEGDLNAFTTGKNYTVGADAYPGLTLSGKTTLVGSKGNAGNSFPVQFMVTNTPDYKIKSGMFGKILLREKTNNNAILIPAAAIIGSEIQPQVYIIRQGKARLQNIVVAGRVNDKVQVQSGIGEGDILITGGFINLFENANVTVK